MAFSGVHVRRDASLTIPVTPSAAEVIEWDAEIFDTDDYHDLVTNPERLTVPTDGYYRCVFTLGVDVSSSNRGINAYIGVNGSTRQQQVLYTYQSGTDNLSVQIAAVALLSANDYFTCEALMTGATQPATVGDTLETMQAEVIRLGV